MYDIDLFEHTDTVNELLARYGVKFGIYKNNKFKEQLFPFDAIPRIIEKDEFVMLVKGIYSHISESIWCRAKIRNGIFWKIISACRRERHTR